MLVTKQHQLACTKKTLSVIGFIGMVAFAAPSSALECDYSIYKAITKQTSVPKDEKAGMEKIVNSALTMAKALGWEGRNSSVKECTYGFDVMNKYPFVIVETTEGHFLKSFITKPFQISWTKDILDSTDARCYDISAQQMTTYRGRDAEWCGRN
jgi:hypothetical protein